VAHEINTPIQYVGDNLRAISDSLGDLPFLTDQYRELVATGQVQRNGRRPHRGGSSRPNRSAISITSATMRPRRGAGPRGRPSASPHRPGHEGLLPRQPRPGRAARREQDHLHNPTVAATNTNTSRRRDRFRRSADDRVLRRRAEPGLPNIVVNAAHAIGDTPVGEGPSAFVRGRSTSRSR